MSCVFSLALGNRRRSVAAWLLRVVMWSRWSHSAVVDHSRGLVYDATWRHGGVRATPIEEWFVAYAGAEVRAMDVLPMHVEEARAWLDDQIGKPYDWTAALALPMRGRWQDDDAWFCSELSEAFRARFEIARFRAEAWRITPAHQDIVI